MAEVKLLPGLEARPWLLEPDPTVPSYGHETRDDRGRVRVYLGRYHPYATASGQAWRYRLVVAYALGRPLRPDEHVDHINGAVDDDRLSNLRLLTPELHGRHHARLFEIAGCRGADGRFTEYDFDDITAESARRVGPVVSARDIDPLTWLPVSSQIGRDDDA